MPRKPRLACLAMLLLLAFSGCASQTVPPGTRAQVAVARASFYKYGPAQTFGADFVLNQGAMLTVLSRDFGFTRVMTSDGTAGYVATDDLKPAPPAAPASAPLPGGRDLSAKTRPRRGNLQPTRGSPLFESGEPAPLPANSEPPKPSPSFRF